MLFKKNIVLLCLLVSVNIYMDFINSETLALSLPHINNNKQFKNYYDLNKKVDGLIKKIKQKNIKDKVAKIKVIDNFVTSIVETGPKSFIKFIQMSSTLLDTDIVINEEFKTKEDLQKILEKKECKKGFVRYKKGDHYGGFIYKDTSSKQSGWLYPIGDLHGDQISVSSVIEKTINNISKGSKIIFLGDYIDRGLFGLEVITAILTLKHLFPDQVYIIRGNHEIKSKSFFLDKDIKFEISLIKDIQYGLKNKYKKYSSNVYEAIDKYFFKKLLLRCTTENGFDFFHGGISEQEIKRGLSAGFEGDINMLESSCGKKVWGDPLRVHLLEKDDFKALAFVNDDIFKDIVMDGYVTKDNKFYQIRIEQVKENLSCLEKNNKITKKNIDEILNIIQYMDKDFIDSTRKIENAIFPKIKLEESLKASNLKAAIRAHEALEEEDSLLFKNKDNNYLLASIFSTGQKTKTAFQHRKNFKKPQNLFSAYEINRPFYARIDINEDNINGLCKDKNFKIFQIKYNSHNAPAKRVA